MTVSEPSEVQGERAVGKNINDGGPAFPFDYGVPETEDHPGYQASHPGMSLRDWFAGQALSGIVGPNYEWFTATTHLGSRVHEAAYFAYSLADAMLAARTSTRKDERA